MDNIINYILFVLASIIFGIGFWSFVLTKPLGWYVFLFAGCFALFVGISTFENGKRSKEVK